MRTPWPIGYFIKDKLNISLRTLSESLSNSIETGVRRTVSVINCFKTENHKTWDGKEIVLRSSYEIEFSNMLDE